MSQALRFNIGRLMNHCLYMTNIPTVFVSLGQNNANNVLICEWKLADAKMSCNTQRLGHLK